MAKSYDDVIDFTLGDPDVPTPFAIKEAGCKAIIESKTRYSQNAGLLPLRETISNYVNAKESLSYSAEKEILVSVGAMEGLYLALLALIDEGDEVIIPAPYYVNYKQMVEMCHGNAVVVEETNDSDGLLCTFDSIKKSVTYKTKAIIINTPCNPTGKVYSQDFLENIALLAKQKDLVIITDEVYKCLVYNQKSRPLSIAKIEGMKERTIFVNSLSKEFCMTGWRLGYVCGPENIISAMTKLQENIAACAPLPSQYAAIEALNPEKDYSKSMVDIFSKRRNALLECFSQIPQLHVKEPEATFYAMVDISETGMGSEEFAYTLLENAHVAVVPGITYGNCCDKYIRIAFTIEEDLIREGVNRIGEFVRTLA